MIVILMIMILKKKLNINKFIIQNNENNTDYMLFCNFIITNFNK